ncbi:ROK family protein [Cytobacillus firmus]|uniref:ROK family protein n=1 Tax=Cytobacillus firmus TaxID=1399 RepID=UPI0022282730|nr:ROK family protein [Cytobacillus firmus]
MTSLVADIGGTKIAAAFVSEKEKTLKQRVQADSASLDGNALFDCILALFFQIMEGQKLKPEEISFIGLGIPGKVDSVNGLAVYQNNLPWRNFPLREKLKIFFPNAEIVMDNDVYMAAFGEWTEWKMAKETFAYVTISTGISSCLLSEGKFLRGAGIAGEIGLTLLENGDELTSLENLASGTAIGVKAKKMFNQRITVADVMDLYHSEDLQASEIIHRAASCIARGLHQLFTIVDPHLVVVGGGVIINQPEFFNLVKQELKNIVQNPLQDGIEKRVHLSKLKADAGLFGCLYRTSLKRMENSPL